MFSYIYNYFYGNITKEEAIEKPIEEEDIKPSPPSPTIKRKNKKGKKKPHQIPIKE